MKANMTQYINNQFQPKRKAYGHFRRSTNQTTNLSAGNQIEFDVAYKNSGIEFLGNGQWKLKAGKTYSLLGVTRQDFSGADGETRIVWNDITNVTDIDTRSQTRPISDSDNGNNQSISKAIITPEIDIIVELRITLNTNMTSILSAYSFVEIQELEQFENPNTYPFEVNAQHYDLVVTAANWTTNKAVGIPYKTLDGVWRIRVFISGSLSTPIGTTLTINISGIIFDEVDDQPFASQLSEAGVSTTTSNIKRAEANVNTLKVIGAINYDRVRISGDFILKQKPDWL